MRVPTANIVLSFKKSLMDRLFAAGSLSKSLMTGLEGDEDAMFFSSEGNPNFISFEHNLNLGSQGNTVTLTFIDPKNEFEKRFMSSNMIDNVAGLFPDPKGEVVHHQDQITGAWDAITRKQLDNSVLDTDAAALSMISKYKQLFGKRYSDRRVYLAYGVGKDLSNWAGPHVMTLQAADIVVEGAKQITLRLVPFATEFKALGRRGAYNEYVDLNLDGATMEVAGRSANFEFGNYIGYPMTAGGATPPHQPLDIWPREGSLSQRLYRHDEPLLEDPLGSQRAKDLYAILYKGLTQKQLDLIGNVDLHLVAVDTIRSFIQNAIRSPNVIVLLPNLNVICAQVTLQAAKKSRYSTVPYEPGGAPRTGSLVRDEVETQRQIAEDVMASAMGIDILAFIKATLAIFGLDFVSIATEGTDGADIPPERQEIIPDPIVSSRVLAERYRIDSQTGLYEFFKRHTYFSRLLSQSKNGIPNTASVLNDVESKILGASQGIYSPRFVTFSESDTRLISVWNRLDQEVVSESNPGSFSIFGGRRTFDPTQPVCIWGDMNLIESFLYGKKDMKVLKKRMEEVGRRAVEGGDTPEMREKAIIQQHNLNPLHPYDKQFLLNQDYNEKIREVTVTQQSRTPWGPFELTTLEGGAVEEGEQEFISENNVPVFRYNIRNPNILNLNFKFGAVYMAELVNGYRRDISIKAAAIAEGWMDTDFATFKLFTAQEAALFAFQRLYSWGDFTLSKERWDVLYEEIRIRVNDQEASSRIAQEALAILSKTLEVIDKPTLVLDQFLPGNPITLLMNLGDQLYRNAMRMEIKTLPFFHLANYGTISTESIVLAQDSPIQQMNKPARSLLNRFYSGIYQITGFKHVITATDAFSEFKLAKSPTSSAERNPLEVRSAVGGEDG